MATDFNPEKEPTPERKWWNVFERQSEFEEPAEKEKQVEKQTERAKELKSAAKQRGHFWESFMPSKEDHKDAEEIAPKGEKVRKKWRALLQRKSEKQVEEFKQEDPETIDSYWLAQLMVAERIVVLHEQLRKSKPKTDERRQIKTELDVLGLLSEKLSDPEIDVPEEIEETYRVIVTVLEKGDQDVEVKELPIIPDTPEKPDQPAQTRERSFKRYGAAVIIALKQAVATKKGVPDEQPKPQPVTQRPAGGGVGVTQPTAPPITAEHAPTPHQTPNVAPGIFLTTAVISAEYDERKEEKQTVTPNRVPNIPQVETTNAPHKEIIATQPARAETVPAIALEVVLQGSSRKFEHMKTEELLGLARSIPLGNGEYLARAYQSGKIDRDGLISVLKTAGRRGNYREEFRRRSAEYIRVRKQAMSPVSAPVGVPKELATAQRPDQASNRPASASSVTTSTPAKPVPRVQTKTLFSVKVVTFICLSIIAVILLILLLQ